MKRRIWIPMIAIVLLTIFMYADVEAAENIELKAKYAEDKGKTFGKIKSKYGWNSGMGQNNAGFGGLVDFQVPGTKVVYYFDGDVLKTPWKVNDYSSLFSIEGKAGEMFKGFDKKMTAEKFTRRLKKRGKAQYIIDENTQSPYLPDGPYVTINYTTTKGKTDSFYIQLRSRKDHHIYKNSQVQIR